MKRIIAFTFFLLFLAAFAFISLDGLKRKAGSANSTSEASPMNLTGTNWILTDTGSVVVEHEVGVFVRFDEEGGLSGYAGCNGFFGSYRLVDESIEIGPLGATRKMCPNAIMDIEYTFMNALQDARTFSISGNKLELRDEQGRALTLTGSSNTQEQE